jgi:hypothetical protein
MLTSFIQQYCFSFYKFPNGFSSLANSFYIAMCHLMWLLSRKYGTVWYHPASSKLWYLTALSFVNFQEKLTGTSSLLSARVKPACSACCVFGARCTFCVNNLVINTTCVLLYLYRAIQIFECKNLVYKIYFWVSYCRSWFLWPETKKLVIPFLHIYLIASIFIRALCIPTSEISQTSPDIHP